MDLLIIAVLGILAIAAASQLSDRIGVAPALILLVGGTAVGFLPFIPAIELDPQVVLEGVLPPLLFSTAVSISTINFRRELAPVAVLAILLVALSAAVIGVALVLVVPGLSLAWAIAMGAILSPTDAVAISIARRLAVSQRIITVLEGEGLLNDATALVLLSSAVSAATTSGGISIGGVLGGFALAVLVALGVGWLVGEVSLRVRSHITEPTVDTVVSFTVPFLAAIPAEHMHGSGLVAAVVAGLITGHRGPRMLPPAHRVASRTNWHTVELTLEGLIFLFMGLEFFGIVEKVDASDLGVRRAIGVAVLAGALTVVVRALVVAPMLKLLSHRTARWAVHWEENEEAIHQFQNRCAAIVRGEAEMPQVPWDRRRFIQVQRKLRRDPSHESIARRARRISSRVRRRGADLDYFAADPLRSREGAVIVWAGMRGAITLAAAQTLPTTAPHRPFLLLVAMLVAAGSLTLQGLTLPALVRLSRPAMAGSADEEERAAVISLLVNAARDVVGDGHDLTGRSVHEAVATSAEPVAEVSRPAPQAEGTTVLQEPAASEAKAELGTSSTCAQDGENLSPTLDQHALLRREGTDIVLSPAAVARAWTDPTWRHDELAPMRERALDMIRAQREALLDAGDEGLYSADSLEHALDRLDFQEIMLTSEPH
ncbi:cation:proton antiporter [Actinomyces naeslundii]|uniref:Sodium:proton antiporter n=1 Tax=Actinomyces naeslundii TaxID=1655 RepID=A0AA47FHE5_ACTNA|nr:sodium:proton antiporter [Actinomyces naeslundii]OMG09167.1 transporter [Actinomyces naeslundii]WAL43255.1 sodium:proton antiporter [Actinomyces naeslundii]